MRFGRGCAPYAPTCGPKRLRGGPDEEGSISATTWWFSRAEYDERLRRLRVAMAERGLDGLLLFEPESVAYLTGFYTFGYTSSFQAAVIPNADEPVPIVRHTEVYYLDRTSPFSAREVWVDGEEPADVVAKALANAGLEGARVGVDMGSWMLNAALFAALCRRLPETSFQDIGLMIAQLRFVKSPAEMEYIDAAARIAEAAMQSALEACVPGVTDNHVAAAVFRATTELGADRPDICLGVDEAAHHIHGLYAGRTLAEGSLVAVEVVPSVNHYHARFMRPIRVRRVDRQEQALARRLLDVQDRAFAAIAPGVPASVPDGVYREGIIATGAVPSYANKTFYSIGLMLDPNTAEPLEVTSRSEWTFEAGMVFHSYLAVRGLWFSETVAVTESGHRLVTRYPRELLVAS